MITIKCCVIDDEPLAGNLIGGYIDRTPFMENCGVFTSGQDAIKVLLEGHIDVVFLDIQMPQITGLELAKIIPPDCGIVFTTAYENYAVESFKVNALDYLLKPVSYEDFLVTANRVMRHVEMKRRLEEIDIVNGSIIVKSDYKLIQIPTKNILYVEGLKDYVKIYVEDEKRGIMTLMSMKYVEKALPGSMFMRVHRSFIVNLSKIQTIERMHINIGTASIPVSETYRAAFTDYIQSRAVGQFIKSLDD
ncbi:MAG: LytTR family DNA-binding domain-containing protein [Clostridium sp.]|nr:LytTR family DNA-binding domain-containing protein [Clostridium sp.]